MPGVQTFVAQRQECYQNSTRQTLGAQNRVPVPRTKLEKNQEKPSFQSPNAIQPADLHVAGHGTHLSKEQCNKTSVVQGGFDTDAESFDDAATMSVGGRSRGYEVEGNDRDQKSSRCAADTANDSVLGAQASFRHGQEQRHHIQACRQLDAGGSDVVADKGTYPETSDEEEDEERDEEELIRDGIMQDLNSPGFSHYLQAEASNSPRATFQTIMAAPVEHGSPALRDVVQRSQKPVKQFKSTEQSLNGGATDPGMNLQRGDYQDYEGATEQKLRMPARKVQGPSIELPSFSAPHRQISTHHASGQQPSVASRLTLQPNRVARDISATYTQSQANEAIPLSGQKGSIDPKTDDTSVYWGSDADRRHNTRPEASVDDPFTRKRARDLDYSPDHISSMTFEQLSNEPFDLAFDRPSVPQELSSGNLATKMDFIFEKSKDDTAKLLQRRGFFTSLSIEQYEECANLIIGRFGAITSKLTDARQQRRRAAKDFEEEVANRGECIRGKTTVVSKRLCRLKRGGEEVVRGAAL